MDHVFNEGDDALFARRCRRDKRSLTSYADRFLPQPPPVVVLPRFVVVVYLLQPPPSNSRRNKQVTGHKVGVPWRPSKRQSQELFQQEVGFWADGTGVDEEEEKGVGGNEGDDAATALDKEVRGGAGGYYTWCGKGGG